MENIADASPNGLFHQEYSCGSNPACAYFLLSTDADFPYGIELSPFIPFRKEQNHSPVNSFIHRSRHPAPRKKNLVHRIVSNEPCNVRIASPNKKETPMVTHFKVSGHLACGHHGANLSSSADLKSVKCRSCRNTDAFKEAQRDRRNAARRTARKAKSPHVATDWRGAWTEHLTAMPGTHRLPRGFGGQPSV
jgi:hypothetical protein